MRMILSISAFFVGMCVYAGREELNSSFDENIKKNILSYEDLEHYYDRETNDDEIESPKILMQKVQGAHGGPVLMPSFLLRVYQDCQDLDNNTKLVIEDLFKSRIADVQKQSEKDYNRWHSELILTLLWALENEIPDTTIIDKRSLLRHKDSSQIRHLIKSSEISRKKLTKLQRQQLQQQRDDDLWKKRIHYLRQQPALEKLIAYGNQALNQALAENTDTLDQSRKDIKKFYASSLCAMLSSLIAMGFLTTTVVCAVNEGL